MIKLKIKYGNSQTDLRFPCTEKEMSAALGRIHAENITPLELYAAEVVFPEELSFLQDRFVDLDEVNFLAKRMDSFFGDEEYRFYEALKYCYPGKRLGDVGHAVQALAEANGFSVVRVLTGHGIGKELHEDPEVRNYGKPNTGEVLKEGMVIAIEPMVNQGTHRVYELDDDWTCVTADGKLSAHYEHTVAITKDGPKILTALPEEA